jgi:hypothetical protein
LSEVWLLNFLRPCFFIFFFKNQFHYFLHWFSSISKGVLNLNRHFRAWPATLFGWFCDNYLLTVAEWPIYNEKYTYLSVRCTTKKKRCCTVVHISYIYIHISAGCCQFQSHQFGWWHLSITKKNWFQNADPWHGQQVDPQRFNYGKNIWKKPG